MSLAENVSARVTAKAYASGVITSNTQATSSSDLVATGGQVMRRTTCTLNLQKDTYQASEIELSRQVSDFRHGVKRVSGSLNGELSPGTYFDLTEAACRGTKASAITASQTDFTSVSSTAGVGTGTFTFAAGNPHTKGFRVGMTVRFTNLSDASNNTTNFLILAMGGTSTRTWTVYPTPTTMTADSSFSVASIGKSVYIPASSHVSRKFGIEVANLDTDVHRLFTECRVGGLKFGLPATGLATIEVPLMGRDMETGSAGSSPFFTSPTAATTTGLTAAVNGLIRVGGATLGVVSAASVDYAMEMTAPAVVGQNFVPEIFLGRSRVSGSLTAFFEDLTLLNYFKNETEVEVLMWLTTSSSATADALSIYMPRVKLGGADVSTDGEAGQSITLPFTALKYATAGTGIDATTLFFNDTAAS